jgi:glycosyltransferase involved in cell wall biosynthesis
METLGGSSPHKSGNLATAAPEIWYLIPRMNKILHIGIDARFLSKIAQGTATYTSQLIAALNDLREAGRADSFRFHLLNNNWTGIDKTPDGECFARNRLLTNYTPINVLFGYAWASRKYGLSLLHTNYLCSIWPSRAKKLMTIHDILFKTHSQYFPKSLRLGVHLLSQLSIRSAHGIIAVSEYSKNQIEKHFSVSAGKIRVIPEAPSDQFRTVHSQPATKGFLASKFGIIDPYVLYVGRFAPIKNMDPLIDFFVTYGKNYGVRLVLAGDFDAAFPNPALEKKIQLYPEALVLKSVTSDELKHLYSGALFLYFVSFGEGFGLPILEAMASGTPVLTSNTTACKETAGHAALKINPFNREEIFEAIRELIANEQLRLTLKGKGLVWVKRFSWRKCAEQTIAFYQEVCHESGKSLWR